METTKETWKLINGIQKSHVDHCCDKNVRVDFYSICGWYWELKLNKKPYSHTAIRLYFILDASCGAHRPLELWSSSSYYLRKCYVRYNLSECDSCSHIRLAHISMHAHNVPSNRIPCHSCCLMQRDHSDRVFLCYHWRSPGSRLWIWESKPAWSSPFCSRKGASCWRIPPAAPGSLQPSSFPSSCLLPSCHRPSSSFAHY